MHRVSLVALTLLTLVISASAQFTFTSLDYPGSTLTTARDINDHGQIVGAYQIVPPRHALLIKNGQYIPLAPETVLGANFSEAFKINDRGDVVGDFLDIFGFSHGFLLRKGVLATLDFPGASDTLALGINAAGTVVGYWDLLDANGNLLAVHGYTWKGGSFTQFDFPGATDTSLFGINDRGDVVGGWDPGLTSPIEHGFICSNKQCTSFDVPVAGATITQGDDINAHGDIAGGWVDAGGALHGFLLADGNFMSLDFPGATTTIAFGINAAGQIVGRYNSADGSNHGFLAQPENIGKPQ